MYILPPCKSPLYKGDFRNLVEVEVKIIQKFSGVNFLLYLCSQIH